MMMHKHTKGLYLALFLGVVGSADKLSGQGAPDAMSTPRTLAADSASAHVAAQDFLAAFDSLAFDRFRGFFADDMTMFFPFPQLPSRAEGKQAVEEVFGQFMTAQREGRARAGRPMVQGIVARDLLVQMASPEVAVVSFHLGAEKTPARRSLVFRRGPTGWKVIHWHASSPPTVPNS